MKKKSIFKAVVAIAVALAFLLPGSTAFANPLGGAPPAQPAGYIKVPSNPSPVDDALDVDANADLSWSGGFTLTAEIPPPWPVANYEIFMDTTEWTGEASDTIQIGGGNTTDPTMYFGTTWDLDTLDYETTYYWQIYSRVGPCTSPPQFPAYEAWGPVWSFTTGGEPSFVSVEPAQEIVENGETFDLYIYIDLNEPNCSAVAIRDIFFNPDLLQVDAVALQGFFDPHFAMGSPGTVDNVLGAVSLIHETTLPTQPVGFSRNFLKITFTADAVNMGTSAIELNDVRLVRPDTSLMPVAVSDGEVIITTFYTLDISHVGNGETIPATGSYSHMAGDVVDLTATADPGWTFDSWTGDVANPALPSTTITMNDDEVVSALFTEDQYTLDITLDGTGTVTKDPDQATYTYNTVVALTPNPALGWTFDDWSGPDVGEIVGNEITMTKDMEVTATFTEDWYTLTITIDGGGHVDVSPAGPYRYNEVVTLTPVADVSWVFSDWSGPDAGEIVGNEITMTKDMEITATFKNEWVVDMTVAGYIDAPSFDLMKDYVYFGEKVTASDGVDSNDLPYPGTPPDPYVAAWFVTDFDYPYDRLESDIRHYPGIEGIAKIWDLFVKADTAGSASTVDIVMSWDSSLLDGCEFDYVGLYDVLSGNLLADMKAAGGYTFTLADGMAYHFQIIAGWTLEFDVQRGWNLISLPAYEENFDKTNLIVEHAGFYRTWDQAIALGWILGFTYGWEAGAYSNDDYLTRGDGYWMWAYTDCRIVVPSVAAPQDHITTFDDGEGWYLVGAPYTDDLTKSQVRIQYNVNYYTWWQADNFIILTYLYDWDRATQNYVLSDGFDSGFGYWMYVYEPCSLKRL